VDRLEDEVVWEGKLWSWLLRPWHYMYSWDQVGVLLLLAWRWQLEGACHKCFGGGGLSFPALKGLGVEPFCSAIMEGQSNLSGALVRFIEGKTVKSLDRSE
jgi:hypothetical protein